MFYEKVTGIKISIIKAFRIALELLSNWFFFSVGLIVKPLGCLPISKDQAAQNYGYLHLNFEQCLLVLGSLSALQGSQSSSNMRFPQDNDWH